jgi:hypothetical protein
MQLTDDDKNRINAASNHISDSLVKTIEQMRVHLMKHFALTGRQLNVAIARSAIKTMVTCAAGAAAADGDSEAQVADVAIDLARQVEAILYKAIGVEP